MIRFGSISGLVAQRQLQPEGIEAPTGEVAAWIGLTCQ